jgi:hypothetical protein
MKKKTKRSSLRTLAVEENALSFFSDLKGTVVGIAANVVPSLYTKIIFLSSKTFIVVNMKY